MNTDVIQKVEKKFQTTTIPNIQIGDTVEVNTIIRDGDKKRIQKFTGIVIAIKGKSGSKTFTVRKISYGVGVEKIFPYNSTNIQSVIIKKRASVRRSKLYFLRDRIGKAAMKLKPGEEVTEEDNDVSKEVEDKNEEEVKTKEDKTIKHANEEKDEEVKDGSAEVKDTKVEQEGKKTKD